MAPPDEAVMAARTAARSARSLEELEANLRGFEGCGLKASAKSTCFYRGSPTARLLIIGEAPGRDEDLEGKPFVGKAGQMLDLMLKAIGLTDADVHITNVVYWRPPGNRTPTPQEVLACRPFLDRQIELVAPEFVLLAGGAAAKAVLGIEDGIMKIRGRWRDMAIGRRRVKAMATLHPAYLLRPCRQAARMARFACGQGRSHRVNGKLTACRPFLKILHIRLSVLQSARPIVVADLAQPLGCRACVDAFEECQREQPFCISPAHPARLFPGDRPLCHVSLGSVEAAKWFGWASAVSWRPAACSTVWRAITPPRCRRRIAATTLA